MRSLISSLILSLAVAVPAKADAPRIVADIPPVQSLTAMVLGDLGEVTLILPPNADAHSHAMRPSEARALEAADLVVWIGPELTPWLERAMDNLAPDTTRLTLLDVPGTIERSYEEAHEDHHGTEEAHDDQAHDDEAHDDHGHDDHDHDGRDPHAWLDPANAVVWVGAVAEALAVEDPANAETYRRNAAAGIDAIQSVAGEARQLLEPVRDRPFLTAHDAWGHFAAAFGLEVAGALADGDAAPAGAAGLAEIRSIEADCLLTEPETAPGLVRTVTEGREMPTAEADPLGRHLEAGPDLYLDLVRSVAVTLAGCLGT